MYVPDAVQLKHWKSLVPETKSSQRILVRDLAQMAARIVSEVDALVAGLVDDGIKDPIRSAIRKVIVSRVGLLQSVTGQVSCAGEWYRASSAGPSRFETVVQIASTA